MRNGIDIKVGLDNRGDILGNEMVDSRDPLGIQVQSRLKGNDKVRFLPGDKGHVGRTDTKVEGGPRCAMCTRCAPRARVWAEGSVQEV